jgi:hypothetical protein
MAVEQLSMVCSRRAGAGAGEPGTSGGSETAGTANLPGASSQAAHPLKTAKGGAAKVFV